ncbi:MAG: hypothetical protein GX804_04775 [Lentisphaerae bacterium]|nr:hypothetical protein [Lentisphaerota bacterium]
MNEYYDDEIPITKNDLVIRLMHNLAFSCIFLTVILSPWCFGGWEMWWFWPLTTLIAAGCLFTGTAILFSHVFRNTPIKGDIPKKHFKTSMPIIVAFLSCIPFLLYALIRRQFDSAPGHPIVAMDAERSLLLFITPIAIAIVMFFSATRKKLQILTYALIVNSVIIAIYATINQFFQNGDYVLWVLSPWSYGGRAKAVFYCPNHLSAFFNIAIALCAAIVFTPRISRSKRIVASIFILVMLIPNFLTLSRGGLASLAAGLLLGLTTLGTRRRSLLVKATVPIIVAITVFASIIAVVKTDNPLMERVKNHGLYNIAVKNKDSSELAEKLASGFWYSFDRGMYIQSALRAWKSNPVWGIGPGQHSSRWPEFAATEIDRDGNPVVIPDDGDYSTIKFPKLTNANYHLYEVHSDWTQLLEEYGIAGFSLMLVTVLIFMGVLYTSQTRVLKEDFEKNDNPSGIERALPLAALLCSLILIIHSLGDFSLQMPAIPWTFASLITAAILTSSTTNREG